MKCVHAISGFAAVVLIGSAFGAGLQAQSLPRPKYPRYAVEHFGERFGLTAATITTLAQDKRGFLWIGTQSGLFRYDGAQVNRFDRSDGLPGDLVDLIVPAPDGSVWVRTRNGIIRFVHERFAPVALPPGIPALRQVFQSLAVDSAGTLFIVTAKALVRLSAEGGQTTYGPEDGVPEQIDAVVRDADDTIWFAGGGQLFKFAHGSGKPAFVAKLGTQEEPVIALLPSPDGRIWIRTVHHVGTLQTQSSASTPVWLDGAVLPANSLGGPALDQSGNLLLPTYKGLYRYRGGRWQLIDHQNGLTSSALFSALEDREGGIWVGTAGAGLDHWPGSRQWSGWTDSSGLPDALVLGVVRDSRSRLWVATNTALALWSPQTRTWRAWDQNGLANAGVSQLLLAQDGAVWALFPAKGLFRFDASALHPRVEPAPGKPARIAAAPDGSIWAAAKNSLSLIRYQHGHFQVQSVLVPREEIDTVKNVSVSPGGVVWTAGPHGLSRFANKRWQHFQKEDGLLSTQVKDVRAISDDEVWIGYPDEGAVTRVRLSQERLITTSLQRGECALGSDNRQNVWLEMDEGVGVVSPNGHLRKFTQRDGLIWNDINCDAFWKDADGSILLGTSKGLARYDPGEEAPHVSQPTVLLTSVLFGKLDRLQEHSPQIAYDDSTFVARFAAPVFYDPDGVNCRFRLRGLEREFTETAAREVRYPSLPAGSYAFEVSCGSSQLGWSAPASYSFVIRPPWWQSWWAESLATAQLLFLAWGFVLYRTRRHRLEKERLEAKVAERSAELAKANRELQEASLRDPLTAVWNRRFFYATVSADASQASRAYQSVPDNYSRDHRDLIFYLVDIDNFKEINDGYGHDAGDHVLVEIARRLEGIIRDSDFLIRWGGEEFLVVCRSAQRENAARMAERILSAVASAPFHLGGGRLRFRTCSVGWAPFPWCSHSRADFSVEEVLRLADYGLLVSKQRGKDQAIGVLPSPNFQWDTGKCSRLEELLERALLTEVLTARTNAVSSMNHTNDARLKTSL